MFDVLGSSKQSRSLTIEYLTGITNTSMQAPKKVVLQSRKTSDAQVRTFEHFVCEVDFMVKLLRACVWMPWRKQAMKDVISCDKPREAANRL